MHCYFQASSEDSFLTFLSQLSLYCIDFCIARPIRFVVGLALNIYDDEEDEENEDEGGSRGQSRMETSSLRSVLDCE